MSEKRLIAIDAKAVGEVRLLELEARTYANYLEQYQQMPGRAESARRKATALRSILAAWEDGITSDEAELLSWAAEESAPYLSTEGERRRLRLADRKLTPLLPDPAPQEAE